MRGFSTIMPFHPIYTLYIHYCIVSNLTTPKILRFKLNKDIKYDKSSDATDVIGLK